MGIQFAPATRNVATITMLWIFFKNCPIQRRDASIVPQKWFHPAEQASEVRVWNQTSRCFMLRSFYFPEVNGKSFGWSCICAVSYSVIVTV